MSAAAFDPWCILTDMAATDPISHDAHLVARCQWIRFAPAIVDIQHHAQAVYIQKAGCVAGFHVVRVSEHDSQVVRGRQARQRVDLMKLCKLVGISGVDL